jgi:type I restriction enzyme S subunit
MVQDGIKVYGQENVIANDFQLGDRFISQNKFIEMLVYEIKSGDILITMMGTCGQCRIVPDDAKTGIIDSHLIRLRVNEKLILPTYFRLLIDESKYVKHQIIMLGKGSIMHGLNSGIIKELLIILPPIKDQKSIAAYLDRKTSKIDQTISNIKKQIDLLKEFRTALISEVVTGKIDVRDEESR